MSKNRCCAMEAGLHAPMNDYGKNARDGHETVIVFPLTAAEAVAKRVQEECRRVRAHIQNGFQVELPTDGGAAILVVMAESTDAQEFQGHNATELYQMLSQLISELDGLRPGHGRVSRVPGFMDLYLEVAESVGERSVLTLAHYFEENGDKIPDPRMRVWIDPYARIAGALSYETAFGSAESASSEAGNNAFLREWLINLIEQGYTLSNNTNNACKEARRD